MSERLPPVPVGERPFTHQRFSTRELPDTPTRDFRIPASRWREAPHVLLHLGDDLDQPVAYIRRIGRWLLWRAGPPVDRARYMAFGENGSPWLTFDLNGKQGFGIGADGERHERFRTWKESLQGHRPREETAPSRSRRRPHPHGRRAQISSLAVTCRCPGALPT